MTTLRVKVLIERFKKRQLRRGLLTGVMVLFFVGAAWAVPVEVINYQALMTLIQKQLTDQITKKLYTLWQQELEQWKEKPGLFGMAGSAVYADSIGTTLACNNGERITDGYEKLWGQSYGSFASGTDTTAWNKAVGQSSVKLPADKDCNAGTDPNSELVLGLIAGSRGNFDRSTMSEPDIAQMQLEDLRKQTAMKAWNLSVQNSAMAAQAKKGLKDFSPSNWDNALPEQATKDMAKMIYFQTLMEADSMQAEAAHEMRKAVQWQ